MDSAKTTGKKTEVFLFIIREINQTNKKTLKDTFLYQSCTVKEEQCKKKNAFF